MANHKSALKRMRQNEHRRLRNRHVKSTMKSHIKSFLESVESGDNNTAKERLKDTICYIDKAATKGVIHKKNASRKISRLTRKFNALTAGS